MANQQGNGRNVAVPDENRPSWRPEDENGARSRRGMGDEGDRYMSRDRDDDRYMQRDRERFGSQWEDRGSRWDRDEGYRSTERYGQGQSGYGGGRYEEDRSYSSRNTAYPSGMTERPRERGLDERFSQGRGGASWGNERFERDRSVGGGGYGHGGYEPSGGYPSQPSRRMSAQDFGDEQWGNEGYMGDRGGRSSYGDQGSYGSAGHWRQQGQQGDWQGHGQHFQQGRDWQGGPGQHYGRGPQYGRGQPYGGDMQQSSQIGGRGVQGEGGVYGQGGYNEGMYGAGGMQHRYGSQGYQGWRQQPGGQTHRGKGPSGYTRSDERIREMVCEALTDDHHVDATNVDVTVKSGEVVLAGTVEDRQQKRLAEDIAEQVPGVKDVQNQIRVASDKRAPGKDATTMNGRETSSKEPESSTMPDKRHRA